MVHSIELLLDPDTESAVRGVWQSLSDAGLRSPAPTSRPHVTMVVADRISPDVDGLLIGVTERLPLPCVIGAPLVLGGSAFTLVRLVIPTIELLALQRHVYKVCAPHLMPGPAANTLPGQWTPHVTLARRVDPSQLPRVLTIRRVTHDINARLEGLRRWNGDERVEHPIC